MGQEISDSCFSAADFAEFQRRLDLETALLGRWVEQGGLRSKALVGGFELEAWLVDAHGRPAPVNEAFLADLDNPLVVPELSTFNVELNSPPVPLGAQVFDVMYKQLTGLWTACEAQARRHQASMVMIGTLPTVVQSDLSPRHMSRLQRYRALNEQVFRLRHGRPVRLHIQGKDELDVEHRDVMLEAATTSFQVHLKVDIEQAVRVFNVSKILSGAMVGVAANSPFLFGRDLWAETRIPLFEQSIAVGASDYSKRVTFGIRYAQDSIMECFTANRTRYPILLPTLIDEPDERLAHLRMHNGTIWRWNRPLVGFSPDGTPHIRIEHRVLPAGPTPVDTVANAAFFFGMVAALLKDDRSPEQDVPFAAAKTNFYAAAREGLNAQQLWGGKALSLSELCARHLLPLARRGLRQLDIAPEHADPWLDIVEQRVCSGRNGAQWQRAWVARHGWCFEDLVLAYLKAQGTDRPVHEWEV